MKKVLLILCLFATGIMVEAQTVKEEVSKMDAFASKTGVIIKFVDYSLPNLSLSYGIAESKIRKLISSGDTAYFYQISNESKYGTKTASIAYEDLLEVIKALETLKDESVNDAILKPDYIENKFVTDDGFQIGYYVSGGKTNWFLKLEKYGTGNTIFPKSVNSIEEALSIAKAKIETMLK